MRPGHMLDKARSLLRVQSLCRDDARGRRAVVLVVDVDDGDGSDDAVWSQTS